MNKTALKFLFPLVFTAGSLAACQQNVDDPDAFENVYVQEEATGAPSVTVVEENNAR